MDHISFEFFIIIFILPYLLGGILCNFLLFQSLFPRLTKLYNNQVQRIDDKLFDQRI